MFAQSVRTKLGFLFPARGKQPFGFAMFLHEGDVDQYLLLMSWIKDLRRPGCKWASDTIDFVREAGIGDAECSFQYMLNILYQSFRIRRDAGETRGREENGPCRIPQE